MFGAVARAALAVLGAALLAAVLQYIAGFMLPFLGPQDELLYQSFNAIAENSLTVMLVAVLAGLVAAAAVEASPRGL